MRNLFDGLVSDNGTDKIEHYFSDFKSPDQMQLNHLISTVRLRFTIYF